jgi:hypothetical protein
MSEKMTLFLLVKNGFFENPQMAILEDVDGRKKIRLRTSLTRYRMEQFGILS